MAVHSTQAATNTGQSQITRAGIRHLAGNIAVALLFFVTLAPSNLNYGSHLANWIWLIGGALMGLLMLIRIPPRTSAITPSTLLATGVSMVVPAMMRPEHPSHGLLAAAAVAVELTGVTLSQVSRLYLGRRFGLLPANRGVITYGPFRFVRHPIYAGWLTLSVGYVMAFPAIRNGLIVFVTLPFIIWRSLQEETLLAADADYRSYLVRTRWRLIPGIC